MPLSEAESIAFRQEIRTIDSDIQSFFRVYYITGIAAIVGWIISSNSRALTELLLGNRGYNIFALLVIAFLNAVALTFLLYRSAEIHELAQFLVGKSHPEAGVVQWELWRNDPRSATWVGKKVHTPLLTLVPILVSTTIIVLTASVLRNHPQSNVTAVRSPNNHVGAQPRAVSPPVRDAQLNDEKLSTIPEDSERARSERKSTQPTRGLVKTAWGMLLFVIVAHGIPAILIYDHLFRIPKLWEVVRSGVPVDKKV
jgi:hypothetical protein